MDKNDLNKIIEIIAEAHIFLVKKIAENTDDSDYWYLSDKMSNVENSYGKELMEHISSVIDL